MDKIVADNTSPGPVGGHRARCGTITTRVTPVRRSAPAAHRQLPAPGRPASGVLTASLRPFGVNVAAEPGSVHPDRSYDPVFLLHRGGKIGMHPSVPLAGE